MHQRTLIAACLACSLVPSIARAQAAVTESNFLVATTGDLVALCNAQPTDPYFTAAQNFCQGFAVGVYRTIDAEQSVQRVKLFCPTGALPSRNEAIANFSRWAAAAPARLGQPAVETIAAFLAERQPCASAKP